MFQANNNNKTNNLPPTIETPKNSHNSRNNSNTLLLLIGSQHIIVSCNCNHSQEGQNAHTPLLFLGSNRRSQFHCADRARLRKHFLSSSSFSFSLTLSFRCSHVRSWLKSTNHGGLFLVMSCALQFLDPPFSFLILSSLTF